MSHHTRAKKNKTTIALIIAIIAVLAGIAAMFLMGGNTDKVEVPEEEEIIWGDASLGIDPGVDEALRDYRTILIFGLDLRKKTDVTLFVCINKKTNKGKVFTIERNTLMQMFPDKIYKVKGTEYEFYKCNHAYHFEGMRGALQEFNRHMDLNARECFGMNWDAFAHLVDDLGGIEVELTDDLASHMNNVLIKDSSEYVSSGVQTLDGVQAVAYLRARRDPGSTNITRSYRNMDVFMDLFHQAKTMSKEEQVGFFEDVIDECTTNMSNQNLTETLGQISTMELTTYECWPYKYKYMYETAHGYDFCIPETLESNVSELHAKIFDQEEYVPSDTVKQLSQMIEEQKENLKD